MDTLVLNASYQPISVINWERAMLLISKGLVEVIDVYEKKYIHTVSTAYDKPSIIRFKKYSKSKRKAIKFSRENIYLRDKGKCQYCGNTVPRNEYTYDHVIPRAQSGKTIWSNIVVACIPCNQRKGGRTPQQAKMALITTPVQPAKLPDQVSFLLTYKSGMPKSWGDYLVDVAYWRNALDTDKAVGDNEVKP
jgi:5-methylcytosine-specific restriction endonuclease McrA